jgi:hypothetical protein
MLFGTDRQRLRQVYYEAWQARCAGRPLQPLQAEIVAVIEQHPEYHALLENPHHGTDRDYPPELGETNPFLHMGMHLAIREQLGTDRPAGIRALYAALLRRGGDEHALQHRIMDCLAEMIWLAQHDNSAPDEQQYLSCIRSLYANR